MPGKTFEGALLPYATQDDMVNRFDVRTLGDLLSDTTTRLTPTQVSNSTVLLELLGDASGELEAATQAGQRYRPEDLANLRDNQLAFLKRLVCDLTFFYLMGRRPAVNYPIPARVTKSLAMIDQLREGSRIFGFEQSANAGKTVERLMESCLISNSILQCRYLGPCGTCCNPNQGGNGCSRGGGGCCGGG